MSKFKVGDRVREIATGDEGVILEIEPRINYVLVQWTSGFWHDMDFAVRIEHIELVEPAQESTQPKLRWLQVEYVKNTDHPMSGLNKHITAPVLQYWDGSDWQTVETVLETRYEHL